MRQSARPTHPRSAYSYPLAIATVLVPVVDIRLLDADFPDARCIGIIQGKCADIRHRLAAAGGDDIVVHTDDLGRGYRVKVRAPRFVLDAQAWAVETLGGDAMPIWGHARSIARAVPHRGPGPLAAA
jgi:hypothetical protein